MIVFRMDFLLFASLLFIGLINDAHGKSHNHQHVSSHVSRPHHQYHSHYSHNATIHQEKFKRALSGNAIYGPDYISLPSTSCQQNLCAVSPNYPTSSIYRAVNQLRQILSSNNRNDLEKKKRIDPMVIHYFLSLSHVIYSYDVPEPAGCDHVLNIMVPEEGFAAEQAYYIVNIPIYRQRVQLAVCLSSGDVCNNDFMPTTCRQVYREEKLLVLPIDTEFDISDFRIRKFKIPNGCVCAKPTSGNVYVRA